MLEVGSGVTPNPPSGKALHGKGWTLTMAGGGEQPADVHDCATIDRNR